MKIDRIVVIILFIISITSCKKDNINQSEVRVGEEKRMIVDNLNTVFGSAGPGSSYEKRLDLDGDGEDDIMFSNYGMGSQGVGYYNYISLMCLNSDAKLLVYDVIDTTFLNKETKLHYTNDSSLVLATYFTYTCYKIDANDEVFSVTPKYKALPLKFQEVVHFTDFFKTDTVTLLSSSHTMPPLYTGTSGDTTFYKVSKYLSDCYYLPDEGVRYIGFSIKNSRLGWIKLEKTDFFKIKIHQTAIQKRKLF